MKNLVKTAGNMDYEFSNINPAYYTQPYKYGYMTQNVFALNGGLVKLNVEDGSVLVKVSSPQKVYENEINLLQGYA